MVDREKVVHVPKQRSSETHHVYGVDLNLGNISPLDGGNYTCIVMHAFGYTVEHTVLRVYENIGK